MTYFEKTLLWYSEVYLIVKSNHISKKNKVLVWKNCDLNFKFNIPVKILGGFMPFAYDVMSQS